MATPGSAAMRSVEHGGRRPRRHELLVIRSAGRRPCADDHATQAICGARGPARHRPRPPAGTGGLTMADFDVKRLPVARDAVAPDGSDVRILLGLAGGGLAHFELPPGHTSTAVTHRTVEEIWFFLSGRGEMW